MSASEKKIGVVRNHFSKIGVAAIEITDSSLKIGDVTRVKGTFTDLTQKVESIEIDRKSVEKAERGMAIGIKVKERARHGDLAYIVPLPLL